MTYTLEESVCQACMAHTVGRNSSSNLKDGKPQREWGKSGRVVGQVFNINAQSILLILSTCRTIPMLASTHSGSSAREGTASRPLTAEMSRSARGYVFIPSPNQNTSRRGLLSPGRVHARPKVPHTARGNSRGLQRTHSPGTTKIPTVGRWLSRKTMRFAVSGGRHLHFLPAGRPRRVLRRSVPHAVT